MGQTHSRVRDDSQIEERIESGVRVRATHNKRRALARTGSLGLTQLIMSCAVCNLKPEIKYCCGDTGDH